MLNSKSSKKKKKKLKKKEKKTYVGETQRNIDHTVVSKVSDGSESSGFLTTVLRGSGEESTGKLTSQGTVGPETTSGIQEGLDLSGHGTETGGDTKQETVSFLQVFNGDDGNIRLGRGVQSGQEFIRESLRNWGGKC
jgi:hypothetical protein